MSQQVLRGGPYSGQLLTIDTQSTLTFTARGMTGFYTADGVWQSRQPVTYTYPK